MLTRAGIEAVREKALRQTSLLIEMSEDLLAPLGFQVGTPRKPSERGGHVALEHPEATRIARALKERGVIPDYRPPDVVRLGPNPLYTSFAEVAQSVIRLHEIVDSGLHLRQQAKRSPETSKAGLCRPALRWGLGVVCAAVQTARSPPDAAYFGAYLANEARWLQKAP
ncbi:MAG: hypothetical protein M0Z66_08320 [Thermaerobacter sp.]|nr:hypothetical protein [Thermaerobacter sp.]